MRESQDSEPKRQPHEDRATRAAEKEKERDYEPPPDTTAIHIAPLAFDVYGRWGDKSGRSEEAGGAAKTGKAECAEGNTQRATAGSPLEQVESAKSSCCAATEH